MKLYERHFIMLCVCFYVCMYLCKLMWWYTRTHASVYRIETDDHMFSLFHFPPYFFEKGSPIGLEAHYFSSMCWPENPWDLSFSTTSTGTIGTPSCFFFFQKKRKQNSTLYSWDLSLDPLVPVLSPTGWLFYSHCSLLVLSISICKICKEKGHCSSVYFWMEASSNCGKCKQNILSFLLKY